jgi:hypothetical protein
MLLFVKRGYRLKMEGQVLEDIVGNWKSKCVGNPCLWNFSSDGTYYVADYFMDVMGVIAERGKITIADGVIHLETSGICGDKTNANGYYQAFLTKQDGKPFK